MFTKHKKVSNNIKGINSRSLINNFIPYPLKYAIADALLKDGKTINYVINYTGLSREIVCRIKTGEIKLQSRVVDRIKEHEQDNLVFLGNSILDNITQEDLQKASLLQKTTSYCQIVDKRRLLAGQSTENVSIAAKYDSITPEKVSEANNLLNALDKAKKVDTK